MESNHDTPAQCRQSHHYVEPGGQRGGFWYRFLLGNSVIAGLLALGWLLLRSGAKPSRFAYPCQQAAFSTASLVFGVPLVAAVIAARRRVAAALRTTAGIVLAAVGLIVTISAGSYFTVAGENPGPAFSPRGDYRAKLYHATNCPPNPVGDRFVGLDRLIRLMGGDGLKFHKSPTVTPTAGPAGLIAASDVVVVKFNYQWPERGGTDTDLLRGLLRWIFDHPDGFTGEVIVCENTQFQASSNFDRADNNAQDHALSPHDVVVAFQALGFPVSQYDWTAIRNTSVGEYSAGNLTDGYVVLPYNAQLQGRPSYPKFRSTRGTYVSLKYGIWNPGPGTYDREHLKFINVPVLKSHHSTYGATACVKHFMGVVTGNLSTNSHAAIARGILGAVMAEVRPPDLNILDCTWINANPYSGPATTYAGATRRDELVASVDPVAADIWSVKNILIPAFIANGYSPPWPTPSADPDLPSSAFRVYLDNSLSYLLAGGFSATNDLSRIDVLTSNGAGDLNCDGVVNFGDIDPFVLALSNPAAYQAQFPNCNILNGDCNGDGSVDFGDIDPFVALLAG